MKQPGTIKASIVLMTILCLTVVAMIMFALGIEASSPMKAFSAVLAVPLAVGVVDIIFLMMRKKWVYYYNLVLCLITATVFTNFAIFSSQGKSAAYIMKFGLTSRIIALIPAVLVIWLCVNLIRKRRALLEYLSSMGREDGTPDPH